MAAGGGGVVSVDFGCIAECIARNQHADDCPDREECAGCIPRRAMDGLMLCRYHVERVRQSIAEMPAIYDELVASLVRSGGAGDAKRVSQGLSLEPGVVRARDHVVMALWSWTRIVMEERGLYGPRREDVNSVTVWLLRHVEWLSAQRYAGEVVKDFSETRAEALAARQASEVRRFEVRLPDGTPVRCREVAEGPLRAGEEPLTCNGTLMAEVRSTASLLPSALTCSAFGGHTVGPSGWHGIGRKAGRAFDETAVRRLTDVVNIRTA